MTFRNCVAVDLGASSGRVMLARYEREDVYKRQPVYTSTGYRICSLSTRNFPIRPYLFYVRRAVFAVSIQAGTQ